MFDGSLQRFLLLSDYFLTPNYHFTKEIVLGDWELLCIKDFFKKEIKWIISLIGISILKENQRAQVFAGKG